MELLERFKAGLTKTSGRIGAVFASFTGADDDFYDSLEETLILADIGAGSAGLIVEKLREEVLKAGMRQPDEIKTALAEILAVQLAVNKYEPGSLFQRTGEKPLVILVIGVNGVGKTTTIGKLAAKFTSLGKNVLLCAGDTFRAAAGEQLGIWARRTGAEIIRREEGADPASVIFDTMSAAKSRGSDVIICDTAGRLHNKSNLMNELSKISRVIDREMPDAEKEILLVLDATTGQNGLIQARQFKEATDITGIVLTKLDGTAKGGIVYAIAEDLQIPVKLVGVGEKPEDLLDFDAREFSNAIIQ